MRAIKSILLTVFWFLSFNIYANNYYFSANTGNDNYSISEAQNRDTPWRSLEKLNSIMASLQAGDSILFKRGDTFFGSINISKSGINSSPIVFGSYGTGANPVISGFSTITEWRNLGGGIYESNVLPVASAINMVVINGKNYAMGRYPNVDDPNKGYLKFEANDDEFSITDNELPSSPRWDGAEAVIRMRRWILERQEIEEHLGNKLYLNNKSDYVPSAGYGYFIQNHIKTLDQFGEWYYNPSTQKLSVFFGEEVPQNFEVKTSIINRLVEVNANYISLENITLSGANQYGVFSLFSRMTNLSMDSCTVEYSGINGIYLIEGAYFKLENSTILNTNNNGVYLVFRSPHAILRNNLVKNTGMQAGMGLTGDGNYIGVFARSSDLLAENNRIINTGYTALYFYQSNVLIKNNFIDTFCVVKDDGGGIYTFSKNSPTFFNRRIIDNIVLNGLGAPEGTLNQNNKVGVGIYMDSEAMNVEIAGNTVENCVRSGINLHDATNFNIHDNTLSNNFIQLTIVHDERLYTPTGGTIRDNIFLSKSSGQRSLSIKMQANEVRNVGSFYDNFYMRPLDKVEAPSIYVEYLQPNGARVNTYYNLEDWQMLSGKDIGSRISPVVFDAFNLDLVDSLNKARVSNFDTDIGDLDCWGAVGSCNLSWEYVNPLNGGALKIASTDQANFSIRCGAIDSTKKYLITFSVIGEQVGSFSFYLRQHFFPFKILTPIKTVRVGEERTDYEFMFANPESMDEASIHFNSGNPDMTFYLDNIGLYEVDAEMTEPEDVLRVETNPTLEERFVNLEEKYMDAENNEYTGTLVLQPFESVVLLVDTSGRVVLPVTLNHFGSQPENCQVKLDWSSSQELNFSHYDIERSNDGRRFEPIGRLPGNSDADNQSYEFVDKRPYATNYYRLKVVDKDGTYVYSNIVVQQLACDGLLGQWKLYPTLISRASSRLTIEIYADNKDLTFSIMDSMGRVIQMLVHNTVQGLNILDFDVSGLSPGVYFIRNPIINEGKAIRFIVSE